MGLHKLFLGLTAFYLQILLHHLNFSLSQDQDFAITGLDEERYDYDTVNDSTLEAMKGLQIFPAKPIQESEYIGNLFLC